MSIVARLLAATPLPPAGDADALLAVFNGMLAARAAILAEATGTSIAQTGDRTAAAELLQRDEMWRLALGRALETVGKHRVGTAQLRAYARP